MRANTSAACSGVAQLNLFSSFDQQLIGEVMIDGATGFQIRDLPKRHCRRFNGGCGCRNPARTLVKKPLRVSVCKSDWRNAGALVTAERSNARE